MQPSADTIKLADNIVITLLQHQAGLVLPQALQTEERARSLARCIAALRSELVAQIQAQPQQPPESRPSSR